MMTRVFFMDEGVLRRMQLCGASEGRAGVNGRGGAFAVNRDGCDWKFA